jgi:hypothetical protein
MKNLHICAGLAARGAVVARGTSALIQVRGAVSVGESSLSRASTWYEATATVVAESEHTGPCAHDVLAHSFTSTSQLPDCSGAIALARAQAQGPARALFAAMGSAAAAAERGL